MLYFGVNMNTMWRPWTEEVRTCSSIQILMNEKQTEAYDTEMMSSYKLHG